MRLTALMAFMIWLSLPIGFSASYAWGDDLLPIDAGIGSQGDVVDMQVRAKDSASLEVRLPDRQPWQLVLGRRQGSTSIRVVGPPTRYSIRRNNDTVFFTLTSTQAITGPTDLPITDFHLVAAVGNEYAHGYVRMRPNDSLVVEELRGSGLIQFKCEKRLPANIVLIQLKGDASETARMLQKRLRDVGGFAVIEPGYYPNLPLEIKTSSRGGMGRQYNYTTAGRLMALRMPQPVDQNAWDKLESLIKELNRKNGEERKIVLVSE